MSFRVKRIFLILCFVCASLPLLSCRFGGDVEAFVDEGKDTATITYDANGGAGRAESR